MSKFDYRRKIILKYIKNKTVLDLGVGDIRDRFLHEFVAKHSKKAIGLEISQKRADALSEKGYNIIIGDAQNFDLKKKFDVILAGDLIEHLENPGLFIKSVKKHMKNDSIFILNTPNIYSINLLLRGCCFFGNVHHFDEHTLAFTEQLLRKLLKMNALYVKKVIYFNHSEPNLQSIIVRFLSYFFNKWKEHICFIITMENEKGEV